MAGWATRRYLLTANAVGNASGAFGPLGGCSAEARRKSDGGPKVCLRAQSASPFQHRRDEVAWGGAAWRVLGGGAASCKVHDRRSDRREPRPASGWNLAGTLHELPGISREESGNGRWRVSKTRRGRSPRPLLPYSSLKFLFRLRTVMRRIRISGSDTDGLHYLHHSVWLVPP